MSTGVASSRTASLSENSRSFTNLGTATTTRNNDNMSTLNSTFGNGNASQAWGSDKIWSSGSLSNSRFASRDATRENSRSRDGEQRDGKSGSGSLLNNSISEGWARTRYNGQNSVPNIETSPPAAMQQQRSASNAGLLSSNGAPQTSLNFSRPPPTVDLTSITFPQRSPFSNPHPTTGQAMAVYTKFGRTDHPRGSQPDSAIGSWATSSAHVSPSDERQNPIGAQYSRAPSSRDPSLPPSRDGVAPVQAGVFRQEMPLRTQESITTTNRAPSLPVQRLQHQAISNFGLDQLPISFGQMHFGNSSTGSTSMRSPVSSSGPHYTRNATSNTLREARDFSSNFGGSNYQLEESDDFSRPEGAFDGHDDYGVQVPPSGFGSSFNNASYGDRFSQTPGSQNFRPSSSYSVGNVSPRASNASQIQRPPVDWQNYGIGSIPMSKRTPGLPDPQSWLDPQVQQAFAAQAQMRSSYGPMMNPYTLQPPLSTPIQMSSQYMQLPMFSPGLSGYDASSRDVQLPDNLQSALMYEFKSNNKTNKRYELRDIYDHIAEFSGDQHGSRFIQQKLETANSDEKERVFREIQPNAIPLMTDVFGNYVIQKFFEHGDQNQKKTLANRMRGHVLNLSLQMYGCRVVQKALEHILVDQQAQLIREIENQVLKCVKDQNGNHVVQKAIERCPSSTIQFIIAAFQGQVQSLSVHSYGCRVIQRCLEHCDPPSKNMIMAELHDGMASLITDQYGNYVVQHVVEHGGEQDRLQVLQLVSHGLETYSRHKFASNVVEKCLACADDSWRREVVRTLADQQVRRGEEGGTLVSLIKDNYGNYVIQKLLDTLSPGDYIEFINALHPAMATAKRTGCGKQVLAIEKKMHRFPFPPNHGAAYHLPMPTPPFSSHFSSAATTPPPALTADTQSLQSSAIPSVNGDTVEGAAALSRKGSEAPPHDGVRF